MLQASLNTSQDTAVFEAGSLLVLNGADAAMQGGTPAISFENANGGSVEVKNDARLLITDAVDGASYKISEAPINYEGGSYAATTAWKNENLLTSSAMVSLESLGEGGVFVARINAPAGVYPDLSAGMASALTALYTGVNGSDYADVNSSSHGVRFLSRGSDTRYLPAEQTASTLEGAARLSSAGAVPALGMLAAEGAAQAVRNRLDYGSHVVIEPIRHPDVEEQTGYASGDDPNIGLNVWATPIYQNSRARDLKAEKLEYGYDMNLGGLAIGADYTFESNVRAGISLNAGGGRAESHGDFNHTENDMNFWGLGAYLAWHQGNFGLLLDTALTFTDNELEQSLPASMGMDTLKADVRARVYQAGAHAEYTIETEHVDITPHVGVRYINVDVHNYDVKSGETV
ncbi:MAG: autotransporter domain-containing protein, partial [Desulfovibrionaceae bacterium]|nr:autotransporter domain-containing protein [Desulfovibrionaceae bacterium]